jgi:hypothetical protein
MEQIHAMLQQRQEDAIKHGRLVKYVLTHQIQMLEVPARFEPHLDKPQ